jgi:hypothetical protein
MTISNARGVSELRQPQVGHQASNMLSTDESQTERRNLSESRRRMHRTSCPNGWRDWRFVRSHAGAIGTSRAQEHQRPNHPRFLGWLDASSSANRTCGIAYWSSSAFA